MHGAHHRAGAECCHRLDVGPGRDPARDRYRQHRAGLEPPDGGEIGPRGRTLALDRGQDELGAEGRELVHHRLDREPGRRLPTLAQELTRTDVEREHQPRARHLSREPGQKAAIEPLLVEEGARENHLARTLLEAGEHIRRRAHAARDPAGVSPAHRRHDGGVRRSRRAGRGPPENGVQIDELQEPRVRPAVGEVLGVDPGQRHELAVHPGGDLARVEVDRRDEKRHHGAGMLP